MDEWLRNEGPNLGFEVHEILTAPGRVSDKIHYSLAGALKEHAGYTQSDAVELENMRRNEVWIARKITDLGQTDRKNMARAHMLRYAKFTSAGGVRVLDKLKSRLVYDGSTQSLAQSGTNTKSCTPRQSTIMMHFGLKPLCANSVNRKADLTSAFLFAPQYTADGSRSFVRLPADIREYKDGVELVYELNKSLYGQRNSPKRFEILFSQWAVKEAGLIRSTVDPCLYYSKSGKLRMLQFVDDSHLVGDPEEAAAFEALFFKRWGARFETCDFYLNMNVRTDGDGRFNLSQPAYAQGLLEKYGMVNARGASTPLVPGTNVDKEQRAVPASIIRVGTDSDQLVSKSGVPDSVKKPQQKGKMPKPKATAQSKAQMETMTFSNDAKRIKSELQHGIWTRIDPSDSWDTLMGPNKASTKRY